MIWLTVLSLVTLGLGLALALWARRKLANAAETRDIVTNMLKVCEDTRAASQFVREEAIHEREMANIIQAHVRKIEDSLTHPRFALNLITGRVRALRHNEEPNQAEETNAGDPDPNCKRCYGRGWDGRRRETGRVIPCICIKRAS